MNDKIEEIRARHEAGERANAATDREWLLGEVERLREENRILRASLKIDFEAALKRAEGDR